MKNYLIFILFFICYYANSQINITFAIKDSLQNPIENATILINSKAMTTNRSGIANFLLKKGTYTIKIRHLIYKEYKEKISFLKNKIYHVTLQEKTEALQEIVITAKEKEGVTTTSVIDRKAMSHLQPSSFADIVSLLPGRSSTSPVLNFSNHLKLREIGINDNDYSTSSLGVSFMIDDVPLNTNANLQETIGGQFHITPNSYGTTDQKRNNVRKGVDMRTISTDDIEKIEIIRGIPSVKYGDLTSGLVKIKRKKGETKWNSRIKSDGFSKLLYVGKGIYLNKSNMNLNIGIDYLDAQQDPRNNLENYKRYTTSLRISKKFENSIPITWDANIDYTGTIDKEKYDPERGYKKDDLYKSTYNNIRITNKLNIDFTEGFLKNINLKTHINQSYDMIKQRRFVQLDRAKPTPTNYKAGTFYGSYLEPTYTSNLVIDGKPLDIYIDASTLFEFKLLNIHHIIISGINYSYAKNNGKGQIFNLKTPPSERMSFRPRAFKDIPSMKSLAFYAEDVLKWNIGKSKYTLQAGLRGNTMLGMDRKYKMNQFLYLDPRINFKIDFPQLNFANGKQLSINISTGYGKQHKSPTLSILYPQSIYRDYEQLNYYHPTKAYRQIHYKTYIFSQVNHSIQPALNIKKEIRLGLKYDYHSLYATFFKETMTSGFRKMTDYQTTSHKKYNTSNIDYTTITSAPLVENLPYRTQKALEVIGFETNGSAIEKQGIEFQYIGKRFKQIHTRFTINGAWLQTKYYNSLPVYSYMQKPIINGKRHYELGLYKSVDDYFKEKFTSTLIADTYIPELGLITSLRFDMNWYYQFMSNPISKIPTHYISEDGQKHLYTKIQMKDPVLQGLVRTYRDGRFYGNKTPFSMHTHLKISKKFYTYFTLSMYVNDLFAYYKSYEVNGVKINRGATENPYFGMELNINF